MYDIQYNNYIINATYSGFMKQLDEFGNGIVIANRHLFVYRRADNLAGGRPAKLFDGDTLVDNPPARHSHLYVGTEITHGLEGFAGCNGLFEK